LVNSYQCLLRELRVRLINPVGTRPAAFDWLALDMGRQLDDWPNDQMKHVVCGSLSYPNIRQQLEERLKEQCGA
jgi:hypothetical protein